MHIIQSNVIIWLVRVEEWAHDRCTKLIALKHVNPHRYSTNHHRCIQHRVKLLMQNRKLNEDHHATRRHPLKTTRKMGMKNARFLSKITTRQLMCHCRHPSHFRIDYEKVNKHRFNFKHFENISSRSGCLLILIS